MSNNPELTELSMPLLVHLTGGLDLQVGRASLDVHALETAGRFVALRVSSFGMSLDGALLALRRLGGGLSIEAGGQGVVLPNLISASGLQVQFTEYVIAPLLRSLRSLHIYSDHFTRLDLRALTSLGYGNINARGLEELSFPALESTGNLDISNTSIRELSCAALVPALVHPGDNFGLVLQSFARGGGAGWRVDCKQPATLRGRPSPSQGSPGVVRVYQQSLAAPLRSRGPRASGG